MTHQPCRIEDYLDGLKTLGHHSARTVDLVHQTRLLAEGYDLRALDHDLDVFDT